MSLLTHKEMLYFFLEFKLVVGMCKKLHLQIILTEIWQVVFEWEKILYLFPIQSKTVKSLCQVKIIVIVMECNLQYFTDEKTSNDKLLPLWTKGLRDVNLRDWP